MGQIEDYVIGLLEEMLGKPKRQARFDWALGDPGKRGKRAQLPFDAVWEARKLIVAVEEDQHRRSVVFWNKPTISGVSRDEQRRIYDERKRAAAVKNGYKLVPIEWPRRPKPEKRDRSVDSRHLRNVLAAAGVDLAPGRVRRARLFKRRIEGKSRLENDSRTWTTPSRDTGETRFTASLPIKGGDRLCTLWRRLNGLIEREDLVRCLSIPRDDGRPRFGEKRGRVRAEFDRRNVCA